MRECSPPTIYPVSSVPIHLSLITCDMYLFLLAGAGGSGGASRLRVCYQRGVPDCFTLLPPFLPLSRQGQAPWDFLYIPSLAK